MLVPSAVPGHEPPADFLAAPTLRLRLPLQHFTDWDYLSTVLALASIKAFRPRVLMVNLPGTDYYGHPYGGPATPAVFKQIVAGVDRNIGRVVQAYKDAGIFDQTLFVVTADHGMVPNVRAVDGALTKKVVLQAGGHYYFHTGGTAAYIYLHNPASAAAVAEAMAKVPNVVAAYYKMSAHGAYYYDRAKAAPIDTAMDNANRFLLGTFVGATAPDVVATFRENTIGTNLSAAHGDHGGLNWGAQQVPLIMSGPGIVSNVTSHYPARLADFAPTMLRLLGISSPDMDGIVLADALTNPTPQEVAAQSSLGASLLPHQQALIQQSSDNIAEDAKAHLVPPASLPARP
jgi:predicted AlkP superfamily pyrophosphatase or phosphodiesterase